MAHFDDFDVPDDLSETLPPQTSTLYRRYGKRLLDVALCIVSLPVVVPLVGTLWLLTRLGGGPGFFAHGRVGRGGRRFPCWKIRTMVPDADARLARTLAENPAARAEWARAQKLVDDPRITRLGRLLRRTSLDELPQVWNILRGEMSIVGPRPITAEELDRLGPHRQGYLAMLPGLTGLWQVAGRRDGCYDERIRMDRAYARRIGLWQDLGLIARTARVVVRPTGR